MSTAYATYAAELSAAWARFTAPREPDAPTVVSLFAGAGGSSLGYGMAGFRELAAVEWDEHAAYCLRRNFAHVRVLHGDVHKVEPGMVDLAPGELDVLDGSPPCQGFSTSGKRQIDDPRNSLFTQFVRLLRAWLPRAFVMENVVGMIKGKMRTLFAEILAELRSCGYEVRVAVLNAAYYRVPQARERVVFVGIRSDLGVTPGHPPPVSGPLTLRAGLAGLRDPGLIERPKGSAAKIAPHVAPGRYGKHALLAAGRKGSFFNLHRTCWDVPCATVGKTFGAGITRTATWARASCAWCSPGRWSTTGANRPTSRSTSVSATASRRCSCAPWPPTCARCCRRADDPSTRHPAVTARTGGAGASLAGHARARTGPVPGA